MGTLKERTCYNEDGSTQSNCEAKKEPSFPGGDKAFRKFIDRRLVWPSHLRFNDFSEAYAIATFVVNADGSIQDVRITKHLAKAFDQEVVKFIQNKKMPKWEPATEYGQPVRSVYEWKITFKQLGY
jgi:protein TonB